MLVGFLFVVLLVCRGCVIVVAWFVACVWLVCLLFGVVVYCGIACLVCLFFWGGYVSLVLCCLFCLFDVLCFELFVYVLFVRLFVY